MKKEKFIKDQKERFNQLIQLLNLMQVEFEFVSDTHIKIPVPIAEHPNSLGFNDTNYEFSNIDFDGYFHIEVNDECGWIDFLGMTYLREKN